MNDQFLNEQRRDPDPAFARSLRERLRALEDEPARRPRWQPALAWAAGVAVVAALFTLPAVRVAAQNALDLFRVRSFAAVEVDEARIEKLKALHAGSGDDPMAMMFEKQDVQEPGKPQEFASADEAASVAGLAGLRKPGPLPAGLQFQRALATGAGSARFLVHADRVQHLLETLDIRDVTVPMAMDGKAITVHMPTSVVQEYANGKRRLAVVEANSPEVSLPLGADLQQLGQIALRVLGLDADEARRVAAGIDWRSTLVVPVPLNAASFRKVEVNGHQGLLVRVNATSAGPDGRGGTRRGAMVLWSEGNRVFAVQGDLDPADVLEVAQSLR
jgi:hypothetical protein